MRIIVPKIMNDFDKRLPLFFLAGPVLGGGDWQTKMCLELQSQMRNREFYVVVPCRWPEGHELSPFFALGNGQTFESQTAWERVLLKKAGLGNRGCIIFWLGCESKTEPRSDGQPYARDTYGELGEWRGRKIKNPNVKVVIGGEVDFPGLRVIKRNYDLALGIEFPVYSSMTKTVSEAIKLMEKK